ncbi:MAG: TolC family protein [Pirellulaceae bacterium]
MAGVLAFPPLAVHAQTIREAPTPQTPESVSSKTPQAEIAEPASPPTDQRAANPQATNPNPQATNAPAAPTPPTASETLLLADVIASVYQAYPKIAEMRLARTVANGQLVEAYGAYDTKLQGYTLSEPTGFYRNYRHGLGLARQTWWGGYLSAGYRIGRGDFQPWYKERETNEGGEFKLAAGIPLLQGRAIDAQRVAVFQATLAEQAAEPQIREAILSASREASLSYWDWLAAGRVLQAQRELLELAETRGEQFKVGVEAGKFPEVDLIFNDQMIAERRGKVLESEQKFRATSFKLALYLRDAGGQPLVPADAWRPIVFPVIEPLPASDFQVDLAAAIGRRPEPQSLLYEQRQIQLEQQLARNNLLPQLDVIAEASQDVGFPASSSNDKGQFELFVGVQGEVPLQRRKPRGKIQSTAGKMAQIDQKLRLLRDKIGTELLTAYNSLSLSAQSVEQAARGLEAARETLSRYRFAFDAGSQKVDLLYINLLESKLNESEIKLVDAQRVWFTALADMQAALGLDPLDQAVEISSLPPAKF